MERLPAELHAYICELACGEDSVTARSLVVVSKYHNAVAKPNLYRWIKASSLRESLRLAELLRTLPANLRRIENLSIDLRPSPPDISPAGVTPFISSTEGMAIQQLLLAAAPTLVTLSLTTPKAPRTPRLLALLLAIPFPVLRDLTIDGFYPLPRSMSHFPRLRRVCLTGNPHPVPSEVLRLAESCPALTRLEVVVTHEAVARDLAWVLENCGETTRERVDWVVVQKCDGGCLRKLSRSTENDGVEAGTKGCEDA